MTPHDAQLISEANRLYWETDESVAEIAERLELSRRALYDIIEPLPTDLTCEVCGGPLSFDNRSARTAGQATCVVCRETGATDVDAADDAEATVAAVADEADERALLVGGAALAGAAIGALLTLVLVPRR